MPSNRLKIKRKLKAIAHLQDVGQEKLLWIDQVNNGRSDILTRGVKGLVNVLEMAKQAVIDVDHSI